MKVLPPKTKSDVSLQNLAHSTNVQLRLIYFSCYSFFSFMKFDVFFKIYPLLLIFWHLILLTKVCFSFVTCLTWFSLLSLYQVSITRRSLVRATLQIYALITGIFFKWAFSIVIRGVVSKILLGASPHTPISTIFTLFRSPLLNGRAVHEINNIIFKTPAQSSYCRFYPHLVKIQNLNIVIFRPSVILAHLQISRQSPWTTPLRAQRHLVRHNRTSDNKRLSLVSI